MKWIKFNNNPLSKSTGDCVIRAISIATNQSWEQVYSDLSLQGFKMADWGSSNSVWDAYLREKGFKRYVIPNTCPDCYTIGEFAEENPIGTYIVATGSHVVAVVNGEVWDSWDSRNEIPTYYYRSD